MVPSLLGYVVPLILISAVHGKYSYPAILTGVEIHRAPPSPHDLARVRSRDYSSHRPRTQLCQAAAGPARISPSTDPHSHSEDGAKEEWGDHKYHDMMDIVMYAVKEVELETR